MWFGQLVKCWILWLLCFLTVLVESIFRHHQKLEKVAWFHYKTSKQFVLFFWHSKVNTHSHFGVNFNIRRPVQMTWSTHKSKSLTAFCRISIQVFYEGHKHLMKTPGWFDHLVGLKSTGWFRQMFVAFLEKFDFKNSGKQKGFTENY